MRLFFHNLGPLLNHFVLVFRHMLLDDDVLLHSIVPGREFHSIFIWFLTYSSLISNRDVVHNASNNMLPYKTQPAVVCVAQVKSTVKYEVFRSIESIFFVRFLFRKSSVLLERQIIVCVEKKMFSFNEISFSFF